MFVAAEAFGPERSAFAGTAGTFSRRATMAVTFAVIPGFSFRSGLGTSITAVYVTTFCTVPAAPAEPATPVPWKTSVRVSVHRERHRAARRQLADIGFVDVRQHLHARQIVGDQKHRRSLQAGRHGLPDVHVARHHHAVDRRRDDSSGPGSPGPSPPPPSPARPSLRLRDLRARGSAPAPSPGSTARRPAALRMPLRHGRLRAVEGPSVRPHPFLAPFSWVRSAVCCASRSAASGPVHVGLSRLHPGLIQPIDLFWPSAPPALRTQPRRVWPAPVAPEAGTDRGGRLSVPLFTRLLKSAYSSATVPETCVPT